MTPPRPQRPAGPKTRPDVMTTTATPLPGAPPAHDHAWAAQGYSTSLINEDLAPTRERTWHTWDILCMWMSDVHSVGGYVFAAGLFFLGLTGWQVLLALVAGACVVNFF